jgi:hypothetical protein
MSTVPVLERLTRNAPWGVRFWDAAEGSASVDGLKVELYLPGNPAARARAIPNRSGVYVAHTLPAFAGTGSPDQPGLRDFEGSDAAPDVLWRIHTRTYRVEVRDPLGRFLPFAFDAELPARGFFQWPAPWSSPPAAIALPGASGSPPQALLPYIPLFSAPARPAPPTLAVVRAQLREQGTGRVAAWCLLGVSIDDRPCGLGLADEQGRVAVIFPYPEPPRRRLASPPEPRNDFSWTVQLTAYGAPASPAKAVPELPDLAEVLAGLAAPRPVLESLDSPGEPLRLTYRQELTVRTEGVVGEDASYLLISV